MTCSVLPIRMVEKIWGMNRLPAPFVAPPNQRIGEVWFEPPQMLDKILVKYIFADQDLSIQTHPTDQQAEAAGLGKAGKEECWLVIDAKPGAKLAIGCRQEMTEAQMRLAIANGSLEQKLQWHTVSRGDFFYIPANTVHAIGAGVSLVEVQQNSDITYRLYDYGRPRELHLEDGLAVAELRRYPSRLGKSVRRTTSVRLVDGPHFTLDHAYRSWSDPKLSSQPYLVVPLEEDCRVGSFNVAPGECALVRNNVDSPESEGSFLVASLG